MAAFPPLAFGLFSKNHKIRSVKERNLPRQRGCATSCVAASAEAGRAACSVLLLEPIKPCVCLSARGRKDLGALAEPLLSMFAQPK